MKRSNFLLALALSFALAGGFASGQTQPQPQPGQPGGDRGGRGPGGPGGPGGGFFGPGGPGSFGRGRIIDPPTDFVRPPTMRIGLITVLKQVGGPEAEAAIAEVLRATARGVELAYAARILEDMAPGKYRQDAITGAKELLQNPVAMPHPTRYDRDSNAYLYGLLLFYKDTSFASTAAGLLVTADGRLDGSALEYLTRTTQGAAIVPAIAQAYYDPRITNQFDKAGLLNTALRYTGMDQQANRMFLETMTSQDGGFQRFMALRSLTQLDSEENMTAASKQQVLLARQQLLQAAAQSVTDERLGEMMQRTAQDLQSLIEGKPIDRFRFFGGPGGPGEPGGGRGGPGGPGGGAPR